MSQLLASGGQSIGASFSFSISPTNDYSGLISFRVDWFDLLAVQETLKSLLQHHCSKTSFFDAQLSLKKIIIIMLPASKQKMPQPSSHQSLQSSPMVHPEETQDGKVKDTGSR